MYPAVMALLSKQGGLATRRQLLSAGLTPELLVRAVRCEQLVPVRRGVYADGRAWLAADMWVGRPALVARAVHLVMTKPHVMSHDSAAALLGLPTLSSPEPVHHVTRADARGGRTRYGVKHHVAPYRPDQVVDADGIPCLDPARTALDIAREHGYRHGLVAADGVLRLGVGRAALVDALGDMRDWPYATVARRVVEDAREGSESVGETLARELVLELGIGEPQTQFVLTDGLRVVRCDLRVGRHIFEFDGHVKYIARADGGLANRPEEVLWEEKLRQDFIGGFKLGTSRLVWADYWGQARARACARLRREYDDTCARFGTDVSDLPGAL